MVKFLQSFTEHRSMKACWRGGVASRIHNSCSWWKRAVSFMFRSLCPTRKSRCNWLDRGWADPQSQHAGLGTVQPSVVGRYSNKQTRPRMVTYILCTYVHCLFCARINHKTFLFAFKIVVRILNRVILISNILHVCLYTNFVTYRCI
jgi:hypothetical protein